MRRREFITLVGGTAAAWPFAAQAQGKMRRIGLLTNLAADDPEGQSRLAGFLQGLQDAGWAVGRNVTIDTNGKPVGYGFTGSANSNNRTVNEVTFGINHTVWKDPKYGALNLMYQYEYLNRSPWYIAASPTTAHDSTIYMNIRYTLPGAPPPVEK